MTARERIQTAMQRRTPDRVPVMCQLALGHYFLHAGLEPLDIWYTSEGFAEALIRLQRRYRFDGILVNLPGRDPACRRAIERIERKDAARLIRWKNGDHTVFPDDDLPHFNRADATQPFPTFDALDPDALYYVEPWDVTGIAYPYTWGFETTPRPFDDFFPAHHFDTIKRVKAGVGDAVSVHAEVFSPWSQWLELLNYEAALTALFDDPGKVKACLDRLAAGAIDLGRKQAACGVDAVLISSAFAGAGFISRTHYRAFVLPYEKKVIEGIQARFDLPVYTHTCGRIGDRLDLMIETGTNGIDTLDPPPLGTVDLKDAKRILSDKAFIKGNIDPVNILLRGTRDAVVEDVKARLAVGKPGGGYILSSACSVPPHTPPENIEVLAHLAEEYGRY